MANFNIGDYISFQYPAVHKEQTKAHDKNPKVLVLHPSWLSPDKSPYPLLHGINFNYLNDDQINLLRMIISPAFQLQYYTAMQQKNPSLILQFDRIMATAQNVTITSPYDFYNKVIKPLITNNTFGPTPYRLYRLDKMRASRVLQPARVLIGELSQQDLQLIQQQQQQNILGEPITPEGQPLDTSHPENLPSGRHLTVFEKFRNKFQNMRGPRFNTRLPVFEKFRKKR